jgi:hypothetical protein
MTLGEKFIESQGKPVEVGGKLVHMSFKWFPPAELNVFEISIFNASSIHRHALNLSAKECRLEINDHSMAKAVVWLDAAPPRFSVRLLRKKSRVRPVSVNIWNAWQDKSGIQQAWIGNSGIIIEDDDDLIRLRCSDGGGEINFDSLVVDIRPLN